MTRIVEIVELCKHEMFGPHPLPVIDGGAVPASPSEWTGDCPGGSRRVLTEGDYLLVEKVDGEWPWSLWNFLSMWLHPMSNDPFDFLDDFRDALAKSEQEGT